MTFTRTALLDLWSFTHYNTTWSFSAICAVHRSISQSRHRRNHKNHRLGETATTSVETHTLESTIQAFKFGDFVGSKLIHLYELALEVNCKYVVMESFYGGANPLRLNLSLISSLNSKRSCCVSINLVILSCSFPAKSCNYPRMPTYLPP